ncbi:MAG: prolyl oligopeptidase family serine peptidase [Actinomycetales bacterium]
MARPTDPTNVASPESGALGYPPARRLELVEQLPAHRPVAAVADPYRWLEDEQDPETAAWTRAQDELARRWLDALPDRDWWRRQLRELLSAGTVGIPVWREGRVFFQRRRGDQEHAVLVVRDGEQTADGGERVLLDPMAVDPTGATTLDGWAPSREGTLLAYQLSEGGTEESQLRVLDVATGEVVDGPIDRVRYSPVAWLPGGEAFYYVGRLPPEAVPPGEEQYHRRVYLHRVGQPTDTDVRVWGEDGEPTAYYGVGVSRDGRWLTVSSSLGTAPRSDLWLADLVRTDPTRPDLRPMQVGVDAQTSLAVGRDGRAYVFTDLDAPRGRLLVGDPRQLLESADLSPNGAVPAALAAASSAPSTPAPLTPTPFTSAPITSAPLRELVGSTPDGPVLEDYAVLDGEELGAPLLVCSWTRHAVSEITLHDLATGEFRGTVPLPGLGSAGGLVERPEGGPTLWFSYTDTLTPPRVLQLDGRSGTTQVWARPPGDVSVPEVSVRQEVATSADGTPVRLLVLSPTAEPDRPRPTVLYGYGGFALSLTPGYNPGALAWVAAGGVYAIANLRGGSEEGETWHRDGMRERKQHVFDDFLACAEHLVGSGRTTSAQLGISGGSNGGLLVGAALTQRPELFRAVVCSAPLLDMVRYEQFGLGATWSDEYGTAADPEQLAWLLSYSPYHRVSEGTAYPAVLFTVFAGDTRVDTMHARKMAAALQHATSQPLAAAPVLVRLETQVGHGARSLSRTVDLSADTLGFLAQQLGLTPSLETATAPSAPTGGSS